jgi:transposase InsO family protein
MPEIMRPSVHERWAHLRFSIVGPLLAAPPARGELAAALAELAAKSWLHPATGEPTRFAVSTIERWYHQARRAKVDPVGVLRRKIRQDSGQHRALGAPLQQALLEQYGQHHAWSYALHYDNLVALAATDSTLGPLPSYSTVRRFMTAKGLWKHRRVTSRDTAGARCAAARLADREVRSFEAEHVNGLWHLDFHHGSKKVLTPGGSWVTPLVLGVLDDRSRLAGHVQWYTEETAVNLVHALSQAVQKRALPRALLTDNGSAMVAAEVTQGLTRLGIVHHTTLPYSPYQNAKQEVFWAQLEGRLVAMLEGVRDLTLPFLNEATQAWVEMEYHRTIHSETRQSPIERYLQGPDVGRPSPGSQPLRIAFMTEERRTQRRSDGTVTIEGQRFEIPGHCRALAQVTVRYARWDLTQVFLVDERTGAVLSRIYPLDRAKNADGLRRRLVPASSRESMAAHASSADVGIAPLLRQLMADYAATGLPPAYLPQLDAAPPGTDDRGAPVTNDQEVTPS